MTTTLFSSDAAPCQYWSIINTDRKISGKNTNLLTHFQRFVEYYNPGYVVIENVPGIKRKADESKLHTFITILEKRGYGYDEGVINANFYGVPQNRKRFVLVASRVRKNIKLPPPDDGGPVVRNFIGPENGFANINSGHKRRYGLPAQLLGIIGNHAQAACPDAKGRRHKKILE